jgi:hypothetical protein
VECHAEPEFHPRHPEEIPPDMPREDRVSVADDQSGKPVKADDAVEEGTGHGCSSVRMAEHDEVGILGEAVDRREDDRLFAHLGKALDEVHGDMGPHLRGHLQGLQHTCRPQRLRLVTLARLTRPHPVSDQGLITRDVEVGAETMEGLLHTLMARRVRHQQHLVTEVVVVRHEDMAPMQEQAIRQAPWLFQVSSIKSLPKELSFRCSHGGPTDVTEEGKSGP